MNKSENLEKAQDILTDINLKLKCNIDLIETKSIPIYKHVGLVPKLEHQIDINNMVIERLKERYNKILTNNLFKIGG